MSTPASERRPKSLNGESRILFCPPNGPLPDFWRGNIGFFVACQCRDAGDDWMTGHSPRTTYWKTHPVIHISLPRLHPRSGDSLWIKTASPSSLDL